MVKLVLIKKPEKCLVGSQEYGTEPDANDNWRDMDSNVKKGLFLEDQNRCG